jgi:hypothetical protein
VPAHQVELWLPEAEAVGRMATIAVFTATFAASSSFGGQRWCLARLAGRLATSVQLTVFGAGAGDIAATSGTLGTCRGRAGCAGG